MVSTDQILSKRKRVSKKNKKSWRKNTEINDVEKFLEAKLREERTGGNPMEKKSKDLFFIDKSDLFQTSKTKLSSMKCHSELQIDTRVAPVVGRVGPSKKKKKKKKPLSQQDISMVTDSTNSKSGSVYDIWGAGKDNEVIKELDPCLQPPVIQPALYKTSDTKLNAVELPHPGTSYNPTYTDHQNLLQTALEIEEKREKEKAKATRDAAPPIQITEEDYIREMSIGLKQIEGEGESESEHESETEVNEGDDCKSFVTARKTRAQRNKEKIEKLKTEELATAKQRKQYLHQINRIKAIKKEIKNEEKEMETKTLVRQEKKTLNETRPGKYGPGKFLVTEPDFVLPEEVSSSLRQLVIPANNVQERFTSLQKRNMLEVRKKVVPHRKYKLKKVEKWRKKLPEEMDELVKMKWKKKKIKLSV